MDVQFADVGIVKNYTLIVIVERGLVRLNMV